MADSVADANRSRYNLQRLSMLVVDDEPNMRRLLTELLHALGVASIRVARDGEHALEILREFQPDVIIADWRMAPMDGLEFIREVRQLPEALNPFVPVMMLSGHTEEWRVKQARDLGVNIFLAKPVSARTLISHIVKLIEDPRPFVRTPNYIGPDRRWKEAPPPEKTGERRKRSGGVRWEAVHASSRPLGGGGATSAAEAGAVEVFRPPAKRVRAKLYTGDGDAPAIAPALVQRMQQTLDRLRDDYRTWFAEDIERLRQVLEVLRNDTGSVEDLLQEIAATSVSLKSLGATFGCPLVSVIAASLGDFAALCKTPSPLDHNVIETHIESLVVVLREDIEGDGGEIGKELVANLGQLIEKANQRRAA